MLLDSALCVSAVQQHQYPHSTQTLTQPNGASLSLSLASAPPWNFTSGQEDSANLSTRAEIMAYVATNPGVYLREVSEDLDLSIGVVQYHLWVLVKNGELEDYRSGRYRRFFRATTHNEMEQKVISLLRQETAGKILLLLSEGRPLPHMKLAASLGVTSQALTWQIGRLKALGIIEASSLRYHAGRSYSLIDGVSQLVSQYLRLAGASCGP